MTNYRGLSWVLLAFLMVLAIPHGLPLSASDISPGLVCISATTDSCPPSPPSFSGNITGSVTVNVVVQGTAPIWGFNVYVQADITVLNATSVTSVGAIFAGYGTYISNYCINGRFSNCGSLDGPGIVRAAANLPSNAVSFPTSGLLFRITYEIMARTNSTTTGFLSSSGCTGTSVPDICVTIYGSDGPTRQVNPETVQTAIFSNPNAGEEPPPPPPPPPGLVCFSTTPAECPSSRAEFTVPMGSLLTVYVVIEGSPSFNGFNIWTWSDPEFLDATSVSIQGTVLQGATVQFYCINGSGSESCVYWLGNGPGIVALAATGDLTAAPTSGLLFSITYRVIGTTTGSPMGFFCTTSPSGPWIFDCANVFNDSTQVSETVQGAIFTTTPSNPGSGGGGTARIF